jgi:hypothetical protein
MIDANTERPDRFPPHLWDGFKRYVVHGIRPGSFLYAFLVGDFHEMCRRGGQSGVEEIWPAVMYLHNSVPVGCFGSVQKVEAWLTLGGLEGMEG